MSSYEQSSIWKKNLAEQSGSDSHKEDRAHLRDTYVKFRKKTAQLAGEIARDLPDFTVHDITHIDALWEYTDLIIGDDYPLNPAEAFVLGGAFLIHDLGMGLAAYPEGINELKKNDIWKDTAASLFKKKNNRPITESDYNNLDNEIEKQATANTLRLLHAKHAEKLATIFWQSGDTKHFLIDNTELREAYGTIIGKIAHSHWQSVEELVSLFKSDIGAPSFFPNEWTIDPLKLACILRVVDAAQIDDRRAPSFLRALRKPSDVSDIHWNFQQKMYKPTISNNRLVYTSKSAFTIQEIESWWVCYDTLCMIDKELRDVDSLLIDKQKIRFKVNGVVSVENTIRLTEHIEVKHWVPTDTNIRVGNVPRLVHNLGGKKLYGDNPTIPLRELVQNSSDAIRARRILEQRDDNFGDIIIRFGKDNYGEFIEVEDNGIGMSQRVLTGPFLDFGESFWGTPLMHSELPGLESGSFSSTGQFGIGFFSVFMWGEKVSVFTNKSGSSRSSTCVLEFNSNLSKRPILRIAEANEQMFDSGTRVRVWLKEQRVLHNILSFRTHDNKLRTIEEVIGYLFPSMDCNIFFEHNGQKRKVVSANDWLSIEPMELITRIVGTSKINELTDRERLRLEEFSKNMRVLEDNNIIYGRLFLYVMESWWEENKAYRGKIHGTITVGGIKSSELSDLLGILIGTPNKADRNSAIPVVPNTILESWSNEQAHLVSDMSLPDKEQARFASVVRRNYGKTSELKFVFHKDRWINYEQLKKFFSDSSHDKFVVPTFMEISTSLEKNKDLKFFDNVLATSNGPGINIYFDNTDFLSMWPEKAPFNNLREEGSFVFPDWYEVLFANNTQGLIVEAYLEVYKNCKFDNLFELFKFSHSGYNISAEIGTSGDTPVILDGVSILYNLGLKS